MKRYVIFFLFWIAGFVSFAQFSDTTELAFLQLVNKRSDVELIRSNLQTAKELSNSLIMKGETGEIPSLILLETAKSFYLAGDYAYAFYYLLADRFLINSQYVQNEKDLFYDLAYGLNLDSLLTAKLWKQLQQKSGINKFLEAIISVHNKELVPQIMQLVSFAGEKNGNLPYKLQHWYFMTKIGVKERKISKFWVSVSNSPQKVYLQKDIPVRYRKMIARKTIKYYAKHGAYKEACKVAGKYTGMKPGIFGSMWLVPKKIRCKLRI